MPKRDSPGGLSLLKLITFSMGNISSLRKVTVKYQKTYSAKPQYKAPEIFRLFKENLKEHDPLLLCSLHSEIKDEDDFWEADIEKQSNYYLSKDGAEDKLDKFSRFFLELPRVL